MPLFALDTDTLSLLRNSHPVVSTRATATDPDHLSVTVLTVEEQLSGWYTYLRQATKPDEIERAYRELGESIPFLANFRILPYTQAAVRQAEVLVKAKLGVRKSDLRIAAVALEHGATVVTRNVRDFSRVPNLRVEDWSVPAP